jgi:hypothetical protein
VRKVGCTPPVEGEEGLKTFGKAGVQVCHQALIEDELVGQGNILRSHASIQQLIDGQGHVNLVTGPAQSPDQADQPGGGSSSTPRSGTIPAWEPLVVVEPAGKQHQPAITRPPMAVQ